MTDVVAERLRDMGARLREHDLYDMRIEPCIACRECQKDWSTVCCAQDDDMEQIFESVQESSLLILATPIYSWYCTPPMKCALDRMVYAFNMYYGREKGPSLWQGKALALVTSCGYRIEKGADLLIEGLTRYAKHSQLRYLGAYGERHLGYGTEFMDDDKRARAIAFADLLADEV
jgi:multimeric flavodoxin WrbA